MYGLNSLGGGAGGFAAIALGVLFFAWNTWYYFILTLDKDPDEEVHRYNKKVFFRALALLIICLAASIFLLS